MSAVRVLVTGFQPFGGASLNPSQAVVEQLRSTGIQGVELHCVVLPVEFGRAAEVLLGLIDELRPQIAIALGQAEGRTKISLERVAINLDDARIADNAGNQRVDSEIISGGPSAYFSTLPVKDIVNTLDADGVPAEISMTAGTFVCNHVFYAMQHHCVGRNIATGLIHMPLMEEQANEFPGLPVLPLAQIVVGIERAIRISAGLN